MSAERLDDEAWRSEETPLGEISGLVLPQMHSERLPNGLTFHWLPYGSAPVARIAVMVPGGDIDTDSRAKVALSAELPREGSEAYPGAALAGIFESNGAWLGTEPLRHWRRFILFSLTNRLPVVLPALVDMIMHPQIAEVPFEACKKRYAAVQATEQRKVAFHARRLSAQLTWGSDNPTARFDSPEELEALSREDVASFHHQSLSVGDFHVFCAGGITPAEVELLRSSLSALTPEGPGVPRVIVPPAPAAPCMATTDVADALQSAIRVTIPAIPRSHPDYVDLRLAVTALGGYFGSRLNSVIREEKGLTYGIHAAMVGVDDYGYLSISSQADARYVDRVIAEIRSELARMALPDYPADELTRLRRSVLSSLASTLESPFSISEFHETMLTADIPQGYYEAQLRSLDALTPDRLAELSALYLDPARMLIAVAGAPRG